MLCEGKSSFCPPCGVFAVLPASQIRAAANVADQSFVDPVLTDEAEIESNAAQKRTAEQAEDVGSSHGRKRAAMKKGACTAATTAAAARVADRSC